MILLRALEGLLLLFTLIVAGMIGRGGDEISKRENRDIQGR